MIKFNKRNKKTETKQVAKPVKDGKAKHSKKLKKGKSKTPAFTGETGFSAPFGYKETDPYIFLGKNKVLAIFDVLIQYGTHNPAPIGWTDMVLPRDQIEHGSVTIIQRQRGMDKTTENDIIEKTLGSYVATLANNDSTSVRDNEQNRQRIVDMRLAGELAGREETIVDSDMLLIVKATSPENIERAVAELKLNYKNNNIKGVMLNRLIGTQLQEFKRLFTYTPANGWHPSDMLSVSAGRIFLPSSGFSDKTGVYVGTDVRSLLSNNPAIIDFRGVRNAVVFMGGVSPVVNMMGTDAPFLARSGGSAVAHVIADSNYLSGQRTHHIMLSPDVNYQAPDSLYFDMVKESINPLEVFGEEATVQFDFNTNINKVVTMLTILSDNVDDKAMRLELETLLRRWFISRANGSGLYTESPRLEPHKARRVLATSDHENYPRLTAFLSELNANVTRRSNETERGQERADLLYHSIKNASQGYSFLFDDATTLPDVYPASARNIYYDLSRTSEDKSVRGMMLINTLAYVTSRALRGEMIVVHGLDRAVFPPESITPYRERIDRNDIGLITVYEDSENEVINPQTCVKFSGRLSNQDAVVIGGTTKDELKYINESWQKSLPQPVSNQLLASVDGILYFYRSRDRVGALIDTRLTL